jgi:hypothetical protein
MGGYTSATGTLTGSADMSLRNQWQRITAGPFTPDASDLVGTFNISTTGTPTAGRTVLLDGVQVEVGSAATDFINTDGAAANALPITGGDSSYGIWEATTNLISNGGFETNTTGYLGVAGGGEETITRITSDKKFGTACAEIVLLGGQTFGGYRHTFTAAAATVYTASVWIKKVSGVSNQIRLQMIETDGATSIGTVTHTITSEWARYTLTATAAQSGAAAAVRVVQGGGAVTLTYRIDGLQVEAQPIATPYVETNGATAARTAARVQIPMTGMSPTQGWFAIRMRMGWSTTQEPLVTVPQFFNWWDDNNNRVIIYYVEADNSFRMHRTAAGAGATNAIVARTFAAGDIVTIIGKWTATNMHLSYNGAAFDSGPGNTSIPTLAATTADVGSNQVPTLQIDSDVLWVAMGTGLITNAQAAYIHAKWANDPRASDVRW